MMFLSIRIVAIDVTLQLSPTLVGSVMVETGQPVPASRADARAINVSPLGADLLDQRVTLGCPYYEGADA